MACSKNRTRAANANYEQAEAELRQAEANENRYRDLVKTGDVAMATQRMQRLTSRLEEAGQPELAEMALAETERLLQMGTVSSEGRKKLKYGTRSLLIVLRHARRRFALLGAVGARAGNAGVIKAVIRVSFWGAVAMALTAGIGRLVGTVV